MAVGTMNLDAMIAHLDEVIEETRDGVVAIHQRELQGAAAQSMHRITRCVAAVECHAPAGSIHRRMVDEVMRRFGAQDAGETFEQLRAIVIALRDDAIAGRLATAEESIRTDVLDDLVGMAERLLADGFKDPAAIIMGTVLAEKLKKLCQINCLSIESVDGDVVIPKNVAQMNEALFGFDVYTEQERDLVTNLNDIRLKALKGENASFTNADTAMMLTWLREFLARTAPTIER